jgi:hypothetical protein
MLEDWCTALALEIAPDEAALAPMIGRAFCAGGTQRAELFRSGGNIHGAFGAGEMLAVLPIALFTLSRAAVSVGSLLQSDLVGDVLEIAKSATSIAELTGKLKERREAKVKLGPRAIDQELLASMLIQLPRELQDNGLPADKCNEITLRMLRVLFADPEKSLQAIAELSKA